MAQTRKTRSQRPFQPGQNGLAVGGKKNQWFVRIICGSLAGRAHTCNLYFPAENLFKCVLETPFQMRFNRPHVQTRHLPSRHQVKRSVKRALHLCASVKAQFIELADVLKPLYIHICCCKHGGFAATGFAQGWVMAAREYKGFWPRCLRRVS